MNSLARRLIFTNKATIGKDFFGNVIEVDGVFLNWSGRNLPFLVLGAWAALMLTATWLYQ